MEKKDSSGRLAFIDYLRIFAFSSVLIGHKFYDEFAAYAADPNSFFLIRKLVGWSLPLFQQGSAGVVVFFFASGYIISHVLTTETTTEFLVKRIFRIYPLYIVACLMTYVKHWHEIDLMTMVQQMSLMGDFFNAPYALSGVEWTLRVEVMFYLIMAILKSSQILGPYLKYLPWVLLTVILAIAYLPPFPDHSDGITGLMSVNINFLFIGVMIYFTEKKSFPKWMLILGAALVYYEYVRMVHLYLPASVDTHLSFLGGAVFVTAWLASDYLHSGPVVRFFSDLTYAVYLLHNWFLDILVEKLHEMSVQLSHTAESIVVTLGLFLACYILMKAIEKPFIKIGRKLSRPFRRSAPQV